MRRGSSIPHFDVIENFLAGNKAQCICKIEQIKEKRKEVDTKKIELLEASKEKSIYEKLKEKSFKEYRIRREAIQVNELDEVGNVYYGRDI